MTTTKAPAAKPVAAKPAAAPKAPETKAPADETVTDKAEPKKTGKGKSYTYIGGGDGSPYVITLMGKQKFVRGELTEVTDPEILAKIDGIPTFVEGKADAATLHQIDQEGKEAMEAQRAQDLITNARYTKKHRGE